MQDHHIFPSPMGRYPGGGRRGGRDGLNDIARWALALLAARRANGTPRVRSDLMQVLHSAVIDPDPAPLDACLAMLVRERVGAAAVADLYVPDLARRLGEDWMEDRLSFVQVGLATARMQAMLRAIGCAWSADAAAPGAERSVALIVPQDEQHTLGALVLLGQLRRLGVTVRLMLGPAPGEVPPMLQRGGMGGVLISVAGTGKLAHVGDLVKEIRRDGPQGLPVVVGGAVLQSDIESVRSLGADLVTADLHAALRACGIEIEVARAQLRA